MKIEKEQKNDHTLVVLAGQLDTLTAVEFEKEVAGLVSGADKHILLDCGGLSYVSSAGLRLLLTLQKGMKAKAGTLVLEKVQPDVMDIFKVTGFASILTIR